MMVTPCSTSRTTATSWTMTLPCFTVGLNGTNYDFWSYELGDGAFTIDLDPDNEPNVVSVEDLTDD